MVGGVYALVDKGRCCRFRSLSRGSKIAEREDINVFRVSQKKVLLEVPL